MIREQSVGVAIARILRNDLFGPTRPFGLLRMVEHPSGNRKLAVAIVRVFDEPSSCRMQSVKLLSQAVGDGLLRTGLFVASDSSERDAAAPSRGDVVRVASNRLVEQSHAPGASFRRKAASASVLKGSAFLGSSTMARRR